MGKAVEHLVLTLPPKERASVLLKSDVYSACVSVSAWPLLCISLLQTWPNCKRGRLCTMRTARFERYLNDIINEAVAIARKKDIPSRNVACEENNEGGDQHRRAHERLMCDC